MKFHDYAPNHIYPQYLIQYNPDTSKYEVLEVFGPSKLDKTTIITTNTLKQALLKRVLLLL